MNRNTSTFTKDPDAVLDYEADWTDWLVDDDTIVTSTWTVPSAGGLTKTTDSHTDTKATVWLSGGTVGAQVAVTNRITTAQGRTEDRTLTFNIRQR